MYARHVIGKEGENIAVKFLIQKGYKIIERNFQCRQGEIDIIASDKNEIVIIEVKTRKCLKYGKPAEAVNENKQKHIYKAAEYYLYIKNLEKKYVRIDVIEVYIKEDKYYINHIKNMNIV
jgi:putative endonuclease